MSKNYKYIKIRLASPEEILSWSHGEVKKKRPEPKLKSPVIAAYTLPQRQVKVLLRLQPFEVFENFLKKGVDIVSRSAYNRRQAKPNSLQHYHLSN